MYFGVGTLHPRQSVTAIGSGRSAVVWLARLHSTLLIHYPIIIHQRYRKVYHYS